MLRFISSNHIVDRGRAEEVLLLETELLTSISGIVGIEAGCDVFGVLSFLDSTVVVGSIELIEIEVLTWARSPETQVVGVVSVETRNWGIIGHSKYF